MNFTVLALSIVLLLVSAGMVASRPQMAMWTVVAILSTILIAVNPPSTPDATPCTTNVIAGAQRPQPNTSPTRMSSTRAGVSNPMTLYWILNNDGSQLFTDVTGYRVSDWTKYFNKVVIVTNASRTCNLSPSPQDAYTQVSKFFQPSQIFFWWYPDPTNNCPSFEEFKTEVCKITSSCSNPSYKAIEGVIIDCELVKPSESKEDLQTVLAEVDMPIKLGKICSMGTLAKTDPLYDVYFGEIYESDSFNSFCTPPCPPGATCPPYSICKQEICPEGKQAEIHVSYYKAAILKKWQDSKVSSNPKACVVLGKNGANCYISYASFAELMNDADIQNLGMKQIGFYG